MARGVNVGMVMGGRAARACDSCGSERARWYCAADEAFLCERCDATVHTANPVARRHDRARLAPNGAPLKIQRSTLKKQPQPQPQPHSQPQSLPPAPLPPARKRPRTPRTHPALLHTNAPHLAFPATVPSLPPLPKIHLPPQPVHIKPEPPSSPSLDVQVPDHTHLLESLFDLHDDSLFLHEVPIYSDTTEHKPSLLHHDDFSLQDEKPTPEDVKPAAAASASFIHHSCHDEDIDDHESAVQRQHEADEGDTLHGRAADESMDHFLVPGNCIDIEHFLDSASPNLSELESEIDGMMAEQTEADQASNPAADDRFSEDGSYGGKAGYGGDDHHQSNMAAAAYSEVCYGGESPRSWLCKVKVETPPELEEDIINGDEFAHEMVLLSQKLSKLDDDTQKDDHDRDHHVLSKRPKLGLQLDIEAVLNAWSDQGSLWMDGQRPDESSLDCLGEWLVPDTNYFNSSVQPRTDQVGLVPVMQKESMKASGAAREARVMRYREKRRNRLFSKKIRYEVRKLNAEKRPRMKGRFVKRTPCMS